MGLDTSHDCWHGAYSAFHRWRERIAECVGIPLPWMEGFYGQSLAGDDRPAWAKYAYRDDPESVFRRAMERDLSWFPLRWSLLKPDVLHELLYHSDCDGELAADICGPLADRLEELMPLLGDEDGGGHIGLYRDKTAQFVRGLRSAALAGQPVVFR